MSHSLRLPDTTRLGHVRLQVADLDRSIRYYQQVLGLRVLEQRAGEALLGDQDAPAPLVELHERPGAIPVRRRGHLGLFHFAILLPDRAALGRLLRHLASIDAQVGASDHLVSEALYLHDPDGLGIEVYADRPRSSWVRRDGEVVVETKPLDIESVLAAGGTAPWTGMPAGTVMGHMHLHVANLEHAAAFYRNAIGLEPTVWSYPGALFLSAGGYHHHLGLNTWAGEDAPRPRADDARLLEWELILPGAEEVAEAVARLDASGRTVHRTNDAVRVDDPWGTTLLLRSQAPAFIPAGPLRLAALWEHDMTATTSPAAGATRPATIPAQAFAAFDPKSPLAPFTLDRRAPGPRDVQIEILYCGVCHSDLHTVKSEWPGTTYPCVPGHEILGRIVSVGDQVKKFRQGDVAAVGCMVDSCRTCPDCREGLEQYCQSGQTFTYNSTDKILGGVTYGGYSSSITVDQDFVLSVSSKLDPAGAAPLLCAGITTWSPLKHWKAGPGKKVGVVGLGGLGHMAVKLARALGAEVVLFTSSPGKTEDGKRLGAGEVVVSRVPEEVARHAGSLDLILNTVSATHDINLYLNLLKRDGTMVMLGVPEHPLPPPSVGSLIFRRRSMAGSLIGGIKETQEMLDFCAERDIVSDVEVIPMQQINEAYERMLKSDVKYRFVIDMASIK